MKKNKLSCKLLIIYILLFNTSIPTKCYTKTTHQLTNYSSTFQSKKNISLIYNNQTGKLICKIIVQSIQHINNTQKTHLTQPMAILFNRNNTPIWNIQANQVKITNNKLMYLYGNVQINNLEKNSHLQSIKTNIAVINLITYDICSNDKITISGICFKTTAMNMQGNLHTKITKLSPKVQTVYEPKHSKISL